VELTPAGSALLERTRRALAEIDGAVADARREGRPDGGPLALGYGPFGRALAERIAGEITARHERPARLDEEVSQESLRRVTARDLTAALVMETPGAAQQYRVRIDTLRDEPLLAGIAASHPYAGAGAIPVSAFVAERVLLPREPPGQLFNVWLRAVIRSTGFELDRTVETLGAPWDRRLLSVAAGDVAALVGEWGDPPIPGVVVLPFDPPLSFPMDLASAWPPTPATELVVEAACALRDAEGWLTRRPSHTELPED
jgi:DNA-binding transcriptional LysR family regulator